MRIKRCSFAMLLAMATTLSFTACSDDSLVGESSAGSDIGGETGYLAFRIKSADTGGMTRAWHDNDANNGDFSFGSEASGDFAHEDAIVNNIQANRVFFFDKDGNYHSSSFLSLTKENGSHAEAGKDHSNTYPEIVYSATVKRTSDRGDQKWPEQCLVVLNGRPSRLNALLARAQADPKFNMSKFLEWVNEDFRDTDITGEGLTLGLYQSKDGAIVADENGENYKNPIYYFTMTNSVYLGKDENNDDQLVNATQIVVENNLKSTSADAAKNPVTVYVERIMSKIEVGFSKYDGNNGEVSYFDDGTEYFLYTFTEDHETNSKWFDGPETKQMKALITNWTINAVEYQTKLFKEIDDKNWSTEYPFEGWNDYTHHRSYWAKDTNYYWNADRYPTQYRTSFDGSSSTKSYEDYRVAYPDHATGWSYGESTEEEDGGNDVLNKKYPWALDYKAFNKIINKRKYKYCLENTFDKYTPTTEEGQTAPSYVPQNMIMGSHVLVQARLVSEDDLRKLNLPDNLDGISDKYYYSDRYYDEETYIQRQVAVINEVLGENVGDYTIPNIKMWEDKEEKDFIFQNIAGGLWIEEDGTYKRVVSKVSKIKTDEDEEIDNPNEIAATDVFTIAPAYIDKGDGKVTIALKGDNNGYGYGKEEVNLYYVKYNNFDDKGQPAPKVTVTVKDPDTKQEQEIEEDNIIQFTRNQLVSLIYRVANTADCFKNGMMYYAVPIQHFIAGTGTDGNYNYKYEKINTGDYGVVRNHWYKFTINAIAKPGIPVHDPNQPIIPNYDMEDRYIGFEVVVLPWHIVDNGNVTLGQ